MSIFGPYTPFILGSYAVTAVVLGALIVGSLLQYRSAKARLQEIESRHGAGDAP